PAYCSLRHCRRPSCSSPRRTGWSRKAFSAGCCRAPVQRARCIRDARDLHGLHISPDLDTIAYTLAGIVDKEKGWGVAGDTFSALELLGKYGEENWFKLGDRDLARHIARTRMLREGATLAEATARLSAALGISSQLLPMSNDRVETRVKTPEG